MSFCYVVKCGDYIKIGESKNPKKRISALRSCNPHDIEILLITSLYNEGDLQGRFTKYWVKGEWYKVSDEILEFIDKIKMEMIE